MLDEFQNAAEECGIPKTNDFNTGDNTGIGFFQFTTNHNKSLLKLRCSAAKGYLNPIKNRKNLKIMTEAHVQKINFEGKKQKVSAFIRAIKLLQLKPVEKLYYQQVQ